MKFLIKCLLLGTRGGSWLFGVKFLPIGRPLICDQYTAAFCAFNLIYFILVDTVANRRRHIEKRFSNNNLVWCGAISSYQLRLTVTGSSTMAFGKTIQGGNRGRFGYKTKLFLTCERYHWCDSRLLCIVVMYSRKNGKHKSSNLL